MHPSQWDQENTVIMKITDLSSGVLRMETSGGMKAEVAAAQFPIQSGGNAAIAKLHVSVQEMNLLGRTFQSQFNRGLEVVKSSGEMSVRKKSQGFHISAPD